MAHQDQKKNQITALLTKIQQGYTERNEENVESFVRDLFINDENIVVVGTSAITSESSEWCVGFEQVVEIIRADWKYWGDLKLNAKDALISLEGDIAFVAMTGMVYENIKSENYYKYRLNLIEEKLKEKGSSKKKLLEIIQGSSDTLVETTKGDDYNWPVRLTMQVVIKEGEWRVKHMHFSYPVTFYPPVRQD